MNEFRDQLFGGKPLQKPLLRTKAKDREQPSRRAEEESFAELSIPRDAVRLANHRDGDRHRLEAETAEIVHESRVQQVTLINLSGGGAMIEGAEGLKLWDRIELRLGETNRVEAAVRWIKGDRYGLEFAHETRIEAADEELTDTLRAVIQRSFPDIALASEAVREEATDGTAPGGADDVRSLEERELRHPLIWTGSVHYSHDTHPVRLRNISSGGALLDCSTPLAVGAELLLDLGEAGAIFATVSWARGDSAGLKFHAPYDLKRLAEARPEVTGSRWVAPDYLRDDRSGNSPWTSQWNRSDLAMLHRVLERRRVIRKG